MALGTALLLPVVPAALAGASLTAFSAGLLGLYVKTPGMRREHSLRPSQQGTALAKDVWMMAIGLGLVADALTQPPAALARQPHCPAAGSVRAADGPDGGYLLTAPMMSTTKTSVSVGLIPAWEFPVFP